MATDSIWPVWPSADGGVNPGNSAIGTTAVDWPRADTAGAHPDPSTIATSCSAIPVRSAMDCAGVRARASGSGGPPPPGGSLLGAPSAELLQHTQEDVSVVGGQLSEPVLLPALDGYLHGVLDGTA